MSLINKMLQDLDARGGGKDAALEEPAMKAVPAHERDRKPLLLAGAGVAALALVAGGWYGWQYWKSHSAPPAPVPKVIDNRVPDRPRFQEPPAAVASAESASATTLSKHAPPDATPGASVPAAMSSEQAPPAAAPDHVAAADKPNRPAPSSGDVENREHAPAAPARAGKAAPIAVDADATATAGRARKSESNSADAGDIAPPALAAPARARKSAPNSADSGDLAPVAPARSRKSAPLVASPAAANSAVSDLTPKQVAENTYRRALASLQEGRVNSALADLDKAVEIDPRNDAARQTYISLLLETKRNDEAIRHLRLALGIDPRQPGLAMVLARLQLEKGGPALKTLLTTLPYASNSADYHGFLAGVLQREQRHTEAAQHYRDALRLSPDNGVWWMGLGISLQAEQHLPEARDAYTRARAANGLTPELQAFIERKLEQLSR